MCVAVAVGAVRGLWCAGVRVRVSAAHMPRKGRKPAQRAPATEPEDVVSRRLAGWQAAHRARLKQRFVALESDCAIHATRGVHPAFGGGARGRRSMRIVSAVVDRLLVCVFAALDGARDSVEDMKFPSLTQSEGTMQELPGPFGSFYSREGWPAVRFEPSRCVCVHAAAILQQRSDDRFFAAYEGDECEDDGVLGRPGFGSESDPELGPELGGC